MTYFRLSPPPSSLVIPIFHPYRSVVAYDASLRVEGIGEGKVYAKTSGYTSSSPSKPPPSGAEESPSPSEERVVVVCDYIVMATDAFTTAELLNPALEAMSALNKKNKNVPRGPESRPTLTGQSADSGKAGVDAGAGGATSGGRPLQPPLARGWVMRKGCGADGIPRIYGFRESDRTRNVITCLLR